MNYCLGQEEVTLLGEIVQFKIAIRSIFLQPKQVVAKRIFRHDYNLSVAHRLIAHRTDRVVNFHIPNANLADVNDESNAD